jgi:hypothetical protein
MGRYWGKFCEAVLLDALLSSSPVSLLLSFFLYFKKLEHGMVIHRSCALVLV